MTKEALVGVVRSVWGMQAAARALEETASVHEAQLDSLIEGAGYTVDEIIAAAQGKLS